MSASTRRARLGSVLLSGVLLSAGLLAACNRTSDKPKVTLGDAQQAGATSPRDDLPAEARTAIDQGNNEFRGGRYDAALTAYRKAAKAAPGNAAPYFGVYMVAQKLGNKTLADSALGAIRAASSGGSSALSDSAMRDLHANPGKHPTIPAAPKS